MQEAKRIQGLSIMCSGIGVLIVVLSNTQHGTARGVVLAIGIVVILVACVLAVIARRRQARR